MSATVANAGALRYTDLADEQIKDIKRDVELYVTSEEYWDKFAHHSPVPTGHKVFTSRRVIAPLVKPEEVQPRAELIAPRPTKITVATFEKTVASYSDKAIYSREDVQFHFDDTVGILSAQLKEIAVQKKNIIKGKAFISTRALITYDTSMRQTLRNAVIVLRKNKVKRWDGKHYLCHLTLEELSKLRAEIAAANEKSEKMRLTLEGTDLELDVWEDWILSVPTSDNVTLYKSDTVHRMVLMGKRGIDGQSPVDVSKLEGVPDIELIHNGLGSGVLMDVDGNLTSDDNKQQGSIGINIDGLGACVSDDLAILLCEVTVNTVPGTALAISGLTGYVSHSGNEVEITEDAGTNTHYVYSGARHDATASKDYASKNTIIKVQVVADEGEAFSGGAAPASNNWGATYKLVSGGDDIGATILAVVKTAVNYDTAIIQVPNDCYSFKVSSAATAD